MIQDGADGADGDNGQNGSDGTNCTVSRTDGGPAVITCEDGTSVVVHDGEQGAQGAQGDPGQASADGSDCTVSRTDGGPAVITCEDGTSVVVHDGEQGAQGARATQVKPVPTVRVHCKSHRWRACCDYVKTALRLWCTTASRAPKARPRPSGCRWFRLL